MPSPFLYSANPRLKFEIQRQYYGHRHYVWCADTFDARNPDPLHRGELVASSSNPAEIIASLRSATDPSRPDSHNKDIRDWRASIKGQALAERAAGTISAEQEQDIVYLVDHADITKWKPVLYVINRSAVAARLNEVPAAERANPAAVEFRIFDLAPDEFDVIEF